MERKLGLAEYDDTYHKLINGGSRIDKPSITIHVLSKYKNKFLYEQHEIKLVFFKLPKSLKHFSFTFLIETRRKSSDSDNTLNTEEATNKKSNDSPTNTKEELSHRKEPPAADSIYGRLRKRKTISAVTRTNIKDQVDANPSLNNDLKNAFKTEESANGKSYGSQRKLIPCGDTKGEISDRKEYYVTDSIAGRLRKRRTLSSVA